MTTSLALLLGPHAAEVLTAAIRECGAAVDDLRLTDIRVQPGGSVRARYLVDVRHPDGSRTSEALVAATGDHIPTGATVVAGEHRGERVDVGIWPLSGDPALPALRRLEDSERVRDLLSAHGVALEGRATIRVRAYRPTQRAVLEVSDRRHRWFVKVVRPTAVAGLRTRHDLLAPRLPVPPVMAHTMDGMVVLPAVPGTLLRDRLTRHAEPGRAGLPAPAALERLLDALPKDVMHLPSRHTALQRAHDSAEVLRMCVEADPTVSPGLAADLVSAANRVADEVLSTSPQPGRRVPVHGDFYHNQLLSNGSQITGLLDVDTAGPGERADEWATLLGYLSVLGIAHAPARRYCGEVLGYAGRRVHPRGLRHRTASVVLALAAAPFRARLADWPRHAARRLELADAWLRG